MRAADVMTTAVVTVAPNATVAVIAKLMLEKKISGVPVVDGAGKLVGIVSEGDLLRRVESETERKRPRWLEIFASNTQLAAEYVKSHGRTAKDVMTRDVVSVAEATPLAEIADLLETKRIKRVPVVRDGKLVGIVSRSNLLRAVASGAGASAGGAKPSDTTIREKLLAELRKQKWADPTESNVVVTNGGVHLWGTVLSEEGRRALRR